MKTKQFKIAQIILLGAFLLSLSGCEKDDPKPTAPEITTLEATKITLTKATINCTIMSEGSAQIEERGVCYGAQSDPVISDSKISNEGTTNNYTCEISGLQSSTVYYARAYAINANGTFYGNNLEFTTQAATVSDIDQNVYDVVEIGNQLWLKQNLKTTKFSNGDVIGTTETMDQDIVSSLIVEPRFQWPAMGDEANVGIYGRHYTWYVAIDSRNVCPTGWHVPSDDEWKELINFMGGEAVAGAKLKSIDHWTEPNNGATDEVGFSAVGGGHRIYSGYWVAFGVNSSMWTSDEEDNDFGKSWVPVNTEIRIYPSNWIKKNGHSIRCTKD